ncbi:hypothetical protein [Caudoviricetes sp.]|nr:hypothetical protein [Caudoviricetes sp.]
MATNLDLRAIPVKIKFDKGKTLNPTFFYLSPSFTVIDLTGYTARMQVRLAYSDVSPLFDLTTANGGLVLVVGTATLDNGTQVPNAHGVKFVLTSAQTTTIGFSEAIFDIELIKPGGDVLPFIKGTLTPFEEVTK